jgi:hypothetical protein
MTALLQLYLLRKTIKEAEERIDQISDQATKEAVAILKAEGKTQGQFTSDGHTFQLQRTDVIDMSNFKRYKDEDAKSWRVKALTKKRSQDYIKALTKEMKGITDAFVATHPEWEPDEIKLTVKCID